MNAADPLHLIRDLTTWQPVPVIAARFRVHESTMHAWLRALVQAGFVEFKDEPGYSGRMTRYFRSRVRLVPLTHRGREG